MNITLPRATVEQALEALTAHADLLGTMYLRMDAITALRAALAQQAEQQPMHPELRKMWEDHFDKCFRAIPVPEQPEPAQEPVAWMVEGSLYASKEVAQKMGGNAYTLQALYTAPPQRKPLTDEEIDAVWDQWFGEYGLRGPGGPYTRRGFARAVERALEEKNCGR